MRDVPGACRLCDPGRYPRQEAEGFGGGYRVEMYDPGRHEGLAEMLDGFDNPLWRRQIPEYAASGAPLVVAACEGKAAGFAVPVLREESGRGFSPESGYIRVMRAMGLWKS